MLKLAFTPDSQVVVDERELNRTGATYTVDTLLELRAEVGEDISLIWLIGSDAFSRLDTWHRWQELFGLAHFAVIDRSTDRFSRDKCSAELLNKVESRFTQVLVTHVAPCGSVVFLGSPPPAVSSTEIRTKVLHGESIRGLTPDTVCDYIEQHKLYLS
jgi:nicotinate-nucleotide adenylyltransferase